MKIRVVEKEGFRPGMSVTAEIETRSRTNVLTVPIQSVTTRMPKGTGQEEQFNATPPRWRRMTRRPASSPPEKAESPRPIEVVFVMDGDHVKMVPVKHGIEDDNYVEIIEGLSEGEEVVSGGSKAINRDLEDGKRIMVEMGKSDFAVANKDKSD